MYLAADAQIIVEMLVPDARTRQKNVLMKNIWMADSFIGPPA
ncbi:hypothetical protein Mpsy_0663 [Methanolobus psychrophilus R15]|nr:hypothetical protein Mpsy_0663 [Methanolobus psychrophilus R15]